MKSGKAAGCQVVAIPDTRFSEKDKAEFKETADVVLDDLRQFDGSMLGLAVNMREACLV